MRMIIDIKPVSFEAAHSLAQFCDHLHGHSYKVSARVGGQLDKDGVVADFRAVRAMLKGVVAELDHRCLNDIIDNPTAERVAGWIAVRFIAELGRAPSTTFEGLRLSEGDNAVEVTP